ncbi:MAG: hypothetical protein M3Q45_13860 [Chloroflexota bacterium]|nr:hypothetical protein [Chloroflexota bacterium]
MAAMKSDLLLVREFFTRLWAEFQVRPAAQPAAPLVQIDYRDRISVATWLVVFGLGISLLYTLPTAVISLQVLGSPVSIELTETLLAALFLALLTAAGTESVIRTHPRLAVTAHGSVGRTWPYWTLPMALVIIAVYVLPITPTGLVRVIALLVSGGLLGLAFFSLYATIERGQAGFRRARFVLDALAYGSALILFLFVYQTRTRSLLSGTLIAMTAILLAVEILRSTTTQPQTMLTYGLIVGMILGQVTWALNYWSSLNKLTGGLLLLLIFYVLVGIAQQGLQNRLNRRVLVEFAVFAVVALLLIAVVGPGFGT